MSDDGQAPRAQTGTVRTNPATPTAEASRLTRAVTRGAEAAAEPGPTLNIPSLRVEVPANASAAEIERAVRHAIQTARNGKRP
ncbi:MAG: hypothetical protein ACREE0_15890 [Phenylobacterium sp.]